MMKDIVSDFVRYAESLPILRVVDVDDFRLW